MSKSNTSSYKKLFSNTLVFAIGSFSSKVLVLLLIPLYTMCLSTAELGKTDVLTQIANWIIPLATMTISEAIIRFGLDKAYNKRRIFTIGNIICGAGLIIFALLLFIVNLTGIADKYIGGYAIVLFLYVLMSGIKTLYTTFVRAMEKVKLFAAAGIFATFLTLAFTAVFLLQIPQSFGGSHITQYLMAIILADFCTTVFVTFAAKLWRYFDFSHIDKNLMRKMLKYSLPLIPAQLLWLVTNSSDSFMTTHYMGSGANGILTAAYKIPNIIATVYMMFGQAWNMSAITEHNTENESRFYQKVFDFNQSLLYILVAGCLLIIQPLTHIMIGKDFQSCVQYSPIIAYSTIFSCFTTFMGSIYIATKQTTRSMYTSFISGAINIGLNILLIPRIGLFAPPISTVASYVTVFIIRAYDSRTLVPFNMNIRKMITNNVFLLVMLGITLKFTNLMKYPLVYALLAFLFFIVFFINMKSISSLFYRFLPARVADFISEVKVGWFIFGLITLVSFVIINLFSKFIPLAVLLAAVFIIGIARKKSLLCIPFQLVLTYIISQSLVLTGIVLIALIALKFIKVPMHINNLLLYTLIMIFPQGILSSLFAFLVCLALTIAGSTGDIRKHIYKLAYKK